jgi:hypothetical protein
MSAIVTPRRSASWRRRASRSSGSFTVVRRMGMPAYHRPRQPQTERAHADPRSSR